MLNRSALKLTVLYVGSSLLAPLKAAEIDINRDYKLGLTLAAYNLGSPLSHAEWRGIELNLRDSDVVFIIHVMDGENALRLIFALEQHKSRHHAVIAINCMPDLMRLTRMGGLDITRLVQQGKTEAPKLRDVKTREAGQGQKQSRGRRSPSDQTLRLLATVASWIGRRVGGQPSRGHSRNGQRGHDQYIKVINRLPAILRFVPVTGSFRDVKNYLYLFCYFIQPTPANIRCMVLHALKHYVPDKRLEKLRIRIPPPQQLPTIAIYHPDAQSLFETYEAYHQWYTGKRPESNPQTPSERLLLDPDSTVGLLLMRPQVVSGTTKHYDTLIRAIEAEGLSVIPAIATLMDNRQACESFFSGRSTVDAQSAVFKTDKSEPTKSAAPRVSQIVSLTGFSFVGGPAMNDAEAAAQFFKHFNRPYRSFVSLDTQTIEDWAHSETGLNPMQAGMQIAIPEIDGATEPFVYGGIPAKGLEPIALNDRCATIARRLKRWNHLRTASREDIKVALVLFCFPPSKGNIGTAADLSVFESVWEILSKLKTDGYNVQLPISADVLRVCLLTGNAEKFGSVANIAYRMRIGEYRTLCPYVSDIEAEWGKAPGEINSFGSELLVQGIPLGNVFVGVQPTFGYEGDPMRLMMSRSAAPHHGFVSFYTYISKLFRADVVIHVGTHGATEFMPGKQIGLSGGLIGSLPNIYIYSVNNPSEGSIAKRRLYSELISYLTPPVENAGLYKELLSLKELLLAYRQAGDECERQRLFGMIEECSNTLNFVSENNRRNGANVGTSV